MNVLLRVTLVFVFLASYIGLCAQQPATEFKLRWFGQSFFQLETPLGKKIVFDPHTIPAFGRPVVSADIICISHEHTDHTKADAIEGHKVARIFQGLKNEKGRVDWNNIDEKVGDKVGAIRVRSVPTFHDNENGLARGKNAAFVVEAEGLTFAHLGDVGHELNDEQLRRIGKVDVLVLPIGGTYTINGEQAKKIVANIKPRLHVVPMHYGVPGYDDLNGPDEFLDAQPLKIVRQLTSNTLVIPANAKPDAATVVLLDWKTVVLPKK
jgi:L-ascorbate metabolism protein UlaG (beta-lactamase superfamily)